MPNIISRKTWGAQAWNPHNEMYTVPMTERTHFLVHYHGGVPRHDRGDANAKEIEAIHINNGWAGIGYNFIVGQDGGIREGRGWALVGAHCPGHNRNGIGVYVAIGGDQKPSAAALKSVRWLYDQACIKAGRTLKKSYHGADFPTACPGANLKAWVINGMRVAAPADPYSHPILRVGSKGSSVKHAQTLLHDRNVSADGVYGPLTRNAVRHRQRLSRLVIDGIVGPKTWAALHANSKDGK